MPTRTSLMAEKAKLNLEVAGYDEVAITPFDTNYVINRIKLPSKISQIPRIIGWAGPARSGTTGLLFLLASHPKIQKAFFQPLKTILRNGGPDLELGGDLICLKEVFRSCCAANSHDPIAMLLAAGVPPEKITWVTMLRDPVQTYTSWDYCISGHTPEHFAMAQRYALELHNRYKAMGVNIIPFAYDLLRLGEEKVLKALLHKLGIKFDGLDFDRASIDRKLVYREEASRAGYFDVYIRPTLERRKFTYSPREVTLPEHAIGQVRTLCQADYDKFYAVSRRELGL